jgi:hypothetical protein
MNPTDAALAAGLVFYILWEAVALWRRGDRVVTISEAVTTAAHEHPVIIFFFGLLMGHWFWQYCPPCSP